MATYTSTQNGPWNDPATWGGGGFPQVTGDVFNIGHLVTLNVNFDPAAVAFGQGNINNGGILAFARDLNTFLPFGHQDLVINSGGWLKVGESGLIIPKTYLAGLSWNTTADNAKGLNLAAGGKLSIYGDPDYFGSDYDTTLVSQAVIPAATNAVTLTVSGDFTGKWQAGQELLVHKGGAYASYINDFCRLAITSLAANGPNTDLSCTVTERPVALTCLAGADVLNLSRNVLLYKYGYNANLGQVNTNRPRLSNGSTPAAFGTDNIDINHASFGGWRVVVAGYNVTFKGVIRNGESAANVTGQVTINGILLSNNNGVQSIGNGNISVYGVGTVNAVMQTPYNMNITGNYFGNAYAIDNAIFCSINANIYSNLAAIRGPVDSLFNGGKIGYNINDVAQANSNDFYFTKGLAGSSGGGATLYAKLRNTRLPANPVFGSRNDLRFAGRYCFEHYQLVANAHYIADAYGDIYKVAANGSGDNPTQRSNGGTDVQEVIPQSTCAAGSYLEIFNVRLWAMANISKTYRFYLQTDFTALAKSALVLCGEYLDQATGGRLGTVNSSTTGNFTTRTNGGDWSQYLEVTVNPAQDGYVNLYLQLMVYEAGKKVWIDPQPEGAAFTPRWSWGEVVLEPAGNAGTGAHPANIGLSPLGVKQVAI